MQIHIEGHDLPGLSCGPSPDAQLGYHNIHVGMQRRERRNELLGVAPGDAASASWTIECTATPYGARFDVRGPYVQGPPGGRFIYLNWGTVDADNHFSLFRRAKLWIEAIPADVLSAAVESGLLVGRLGLTDGKGNPLCASVRPPTIEWRAERG